MSTLAALLALAAAGSGSLSFWLALALIWLGLIAFVLVAVNRYRDHLEGRANERPIARIQANGFIRYKKERPRVTR